MTAPAVAMLFDGLIESLEQSRAGWWLVRDQADKVGDDTALALANARIDTWDAAIRLTRTWAASGTPTTEGA